MTDRNRTIIGGAAITRELKSGYRISACAHLLYLLEAGVHRDLNLGAHGLKLARENLKTVALGRDGQHLVLDGGRLEAGALGDADKTALTGYYARMLRFARILAR